MASSADAPDPGEAYVRPSARARLGVGAAVIAIIVALAATVVVGILRSGAAPTERVALSDEPSVSMESAEIYVHVFGAVRRPGLYLLPEGARVFDAVAAAEGFAEGADPGTVNLARLLSDGEQLHIADAASSAAITAQEPGDGRVNLNAADAAELETLPRIGPAMAERIIQWREDNGRFTSVEDLLAVPGIGDKMLEALRDLVTL